MGATAAPQAQGKHPKMILSEWLRTKTGEQPTKDSILYNTVEVEGSKPPQFVCELTLLSLDPNKVYKGKPSPSKKAAETSAAEAALKQNNQGASLKAGAASAAGKAKAKAKAKGKDKAKDPAKEATIQKLKAIDSSCKVWVGGLSEKTTQKALTNHFAQVAKPKIVDLMKKGKAVVAYGSEGEAAAAIAALSGSELDGKTLEVDVWTTK